jgi:hypothetical protein
VNNKRKFIEVGSVFDKITIDSFLKKKWDITYRNYCLCMASKEVTEDDCSWTDNPHLCIGCWQICVLDDGTAVTWCLDN